MRPSKRECQSLGNDDDNDAVPRHASPAASFEFYRRPGDTGPSQLHPMSSVGPLRFEVR